MVLEVNVGVLGILNGVLKCRALILNGKPFEEVDYIKYLGSQVVADKGYEREVVHGMNEL